MTDSGSGKEFQCQYYAKKKDGECHKVKKCSHINEEGKCINSHQRVDDKKCTWSTDNEKCITEEEGKKEDCMLRVEYSEKYKPLLKTLNYFRSLIDYYIQKLMKVKLIIILIHYQIHIILMKMLNISNH